MTTGQDHGLAKALDNKLIQLAAARSSEGTPVRLDLPVRNVNRTVGTMLGCEVTRRWGGDGLPDDTIDVDLTGSAGQSLGAFLPRGITLRLDGDANDYVGKGLSGGRIIVAAGPSGRPSPPSEKIIAGNVIGYGATERRDLHARRGGRAVLRAQLRRHRGRRGRGDHGCEYMTGGRVVVLGPTGRNFAAGMTGGIAYVLDPDPRRVNREMVDLEPLDRRGRRLAARAARAPPGRDRLGGGGRAARGLADAALPRFARVMPRDYRRVLEAAAGPSATARTSARP